MHTSGRLQRESSIELHINSLTKYSESHSSIRGGGVAALAVDKVADDTRKRELAFNSLYRWVQRTQDQRSFEIFFLIFLLLHTHTDVYDLWLWSGRRVNIYEYWNTCYSAEVLVYFFIDFSSKPNNRIASHPVTGQWMQKKRYREERFHKFKSNMFDSTLQPTNR